MPTALVVVRLVHRNTDRNVRVFRGDVWMPCEPVSGRKFREAKLTGEFVTRDKNSCRKRIQRYPPKKVNNYEENVWC